MWESRRVYGAGCSMGWVDISVGEQEGLWGGWFYGVGGFKCGRAGGSMGWVVL